MSDRRAEQREDSIAGGLHDVAIVAWTASIISFNAGSMIARATSGSRFSINSVEPLMSANNAVTVLRSPSGRVAESGYSGVRRICGAIGGAGGACAEPA
jgi:hypothetical protein